jgi:hypothetical protein
VKGFKSKTIIKWPVQQMPSIDTHRIWVKHIKDITNFNGSGKIQTTLGDWIHIPNKTRHIQYWIHKDKELLINQPINNGKWYMHKLKNDAYGKLSFWIIGKEHIQQINFLEFYPVDIKESNNVLILDSCVLWDIYL